MSTIYSRPLHIAAAFCLTLSFLPSLTVAGLSGDPIIDLTLGSAYELRVGGSGGGIDRGIGSNAIKCNSAGAPPNESNCPNDATYTPAEATGGYQAWGVGTAAFFFEELEYQCTYELIPIWDGGSVIWTWQIVCDLVVVITPGGTLGNAMAVLRWGEDIDGTQPWSVEPTSILAFHENLATDCVPILLGVEAECANPADSSYVSDNGYEVDIVIEDPACTLPTRTGTDIDYSANCFTYHELTQVSNLPEMYQDTTEEDDGNTFAIGFGSADGAGIDPGTTYIVRQPFHSRAQPNMLGRPAYHLGSISSEFESVPICFGSLLNPALCYFAIDIAAVGGGHNNFSPVIVP